MQMQTIKKVASGAVGLFLTGATLMGPALAVADLSDFQNMGPSDTLIVVGGDAITADVIGGINIGGKLAQSGIESATCSVTCADGGAAQVTDGVKIETSSKKLYLNTETGRENSLSDVKATLSSNDLSLLAKQTVEYDDGTTTTMNQVLELTANTHVEYSEADPAAETDTPRLILNNDAGKVLYNLTMTFPTGLDMRDPDVVTAAPGIAGKDITIMGKTFTVGVQNDLAYNKIVLYGGGEEKTLVAAGDSVSFELDGETHTIRMTSWTGSGTSIKGVFELDGVSYTKAANSAITINAETNSQITIKKVEETKVPSIAGGAATEGAQATLFIGSAKLILENGQEVKKGDDYISGANVEITNTTSNKMTKIKISYAPDEDVTSETDVAYTEPVLSAFDFVLTGITPGLDSASRDKLILAKNGKKVKLTVETKDGNTLALNVYEATAANTFKLAIDAKDFHINDTQYSVGISDYILASDGEYSNVLQFKTMDKTNNLLTLRDIGSGDDIEVSYDGSGDGTMYIGSASYTISNVVEGTTKTFDLAAWGGTGSFSGNLPIVSRNGAVITLQSGKSGDQTTTSAVAYVNVSELDTVESEADPTHVDMKLGFVTKASSAEIDSVNMTNEPSVFATVGDGNVYAGLTAYGTFVKRDTDADSVIMWYPDEQAYVNVYVMKAGVSPPTTTSTGTEVTQTVSVEAPSLGNGIAKLDSEVTAADKQEKNLILVGGPAANKLVEDLAAAEKTPDLAYWTANLQGSYILQALDAPFGGKTAIVVAGWSASDTQAASLKLATEDVSGAAVSCMGTSCSEFTYPAEEAAVEEEEAEEEPEEPEESAE